MLTTHVQRWRAGRASGRPAGELFDARRFSVQPIPDDTTAAAFIRRHHYSGTYPVARFRFGLFRDGVPADDGLPAGLVGVAVFGVPAQARVTTNWLEGDALQHVDLSRFVLLDDVRANGETWMLARCFRHLAAAGMEGVVSFADPVARTSACGRLTFGGHVGTIYQASGAVYTGRATARTLRLLPDATVFSDRTAQKVRQLEQGWEGAVAQLVRHGARPMPTADPDPSVATAWLARETARVCRPLRHPGNLRYLFPIGRGRVRAGVQALPYLKARDLLPRPVQLALAA